MHDDTAFLAGCKSVGLPCPRLSWLQKKTKFTPHSVATRRNTDNGNIGRAVDPGTIVSRCFLPGAADGKQPKLRGSGGGADVLQASGRRHWRRPMPHGGGAAPTADAPFLRGPAPLEVSRASAEAAERPGDFVPWSGGGSLGRAAHFGTARHDERVGRWGACPCRFTAWCGASAFGRAPALRGGWSKHCGRNAPGEPARTNGMCSLALVAARQVDIWILSNRVGPGSAARDSGASAVRRLRAGRSDYFDRTVCGSIGGRGFVNLAILRGVAKLGAVAKAQTPGIGLVARTLKSRVIEMPLLWQDTCRPGVLVAKLGFAAVATQ